MPKTALCVVELVLLLPLQFLDPKFCQTALFTLNTNTHPIDILKRGGLRAILDRILYCEKHRRPEADPFRTEGGSRRHPPRSISLTIPAPPVPRISGGEDTASSRHIGYTGLSYVKTNNELKYVQRYVKTRRVAPVKGWPQMRSR